MKRFLFLLIALPLFCLAQTPANCIKVTHSHFYYYFDTLIKAPIYTFYVQTTAHAKMGSLDRKGYPTFHEDTLIPKRFRVATKAKYANWNKAHKTKRRDIGHSAPYTALAYDSTGAAESMNIDQCGPQASYFNEHQWEGVEMEVLKNLAPKQDSISVWTGFIYDTVNVVPVPANMKYMGDVPEAWYYWKVAKWVNGGQVFYKAWLGPNTDENRDTNPDDIIVNVDKIELLTSMKF